MDSVTHIYFANRLLKMVGGDTSAAVASLFPQIDREPAYFHRMYGHPYFQIARLAKIGAEVYSTGRVSDDVEPGDEYAWGRFEADRPRMLNFARQFESEGGEQVTDLTGGQRDVILAYASHTYQDIFNNPMQGFLPRNVYPCGKWDFWMTLDHAIDYRTILYKADNIAEFRAEFFSNSIWNASLDADALVEAMVRRTAAACAVPVDPAIVDDAVRALGVSVESVPQERRAAADEFMEEHEHLLEETTRKYASPKVSVGVGTSFESPYPVGS